MAGISERKKPKVVFVDDEQRVLNSMRVRFRREYDLHLTTRGSEALEMLGEHDIDVIVADQRMPEMQGTEVLAEAKCLSPRTVRILLTGYADLDAIEASINDGEVFRFLTKPCAPEELRSTIEQAIEIARDEQAIMALEAEPAAVDPTAAPSPVSLDVIEEETTEGDLDLVATDVQTDTNLLQFDSQPATTATTAAADTERVSVDTAPTVAAAHEEPDQASAAMASEESDLAAADTGKQEVFLPEPLVQAAQASDDDPDAITIVLEGDSASVMDTENEEIETVSAADAAGVADKIGVLVFSEDKKTLEEIREMLGDRYMVVGAGNIVSVTKLLKATRPGVLVTDISEDLEIIESMVNALKAHLPELVTIVVGEHRDTVGLVNLINYGQIYRFLQKPLAAGTFCMTVKAATRKHLQLRKYPELARRYAVRQKEDDEHVRGGALRNLLERLRSMSRLWATHS